MGRNQESALNWSLDNGDIRWNLKELRLPPLRVPRALSSLSERGQQAIDTGRSDACIAIKKAQVETNSPIDAIILLASVSPATILTCGQEKTSDINLAHRYFFGYMTELMKTAAIQLTKLSN